MADSRRAGRAVATGPGKVLVAVYGLFALAAGARAGVQIATRFGEAPVAYLLSAFAALVYLTATVGLARGGSTGRRVAWVCCSVELAGVVIIGTVSLLASDAFPDATVWSGFGRGYGYVPLVLPVLGLYWLRRTSSSGVGQHPEGSQGELADRSGKNPDDRAGSSE